MAEKEASLLIRIKQVGAEALDHIVVTLGDIKEAAKKLYEMTIGQVEKAVEEYRQQEIAVNKLNQSLVQQGLYTRDLSEAYQEYARELSEVSQFKDEEIIQAEAVMQGFLGQKKVTKELMQATLDLAAAKGMDLASAAQMVGRSIGTEQNALQRLGVSLQAGMNETERLDAVTKKLTNTFGGQAEAAVKGLGAFTLLKHKIEDVYKSVGEALAPTIEAIIPVLMQFADTAGNWVTKNVSILTDSFKILLQAAIRTGEAVLVIGNALGGMISMAVQAVMAVADGNLKQAWQVLKDGAQGVADDTIKIHDEANQKIDAINGIAVQNQKKKLANEEELIKKSAERRMQINADTTQLEQDAFVIKSQNELAAMGAHDEVKAALLEQQRIIEAEKVKGHERDLSLIMQAEEKKRLIMEKGVHDEKMKMGDVADKFDEFMAQKRMQRATQTLNDLSQLQNSKHKEMVIIGKAAAAVNIAIDTARAAMGAYAALSGIPYVGPALAYGAAAAIIAYGAERESEVAGLQLAEGGIVPARPGGVQATIGEGGQDEAVIPLGSGEANQRLGGMSGGTTVIVNGGLLGDRASAREFAIAVDKELFELRRSGQSIAFDSRLT